MANVKTTDELVRTPITGSELVRLATPGDNWRTTLASIFAAMGTAGPVGATGATGPAGTTLDWVNVKDPAFGAIGNGVADDTVAIQAAIDFAYAHQFQVIYLPAGTYKISNTIYLDPPGNLRVNFANPTINAFSMHLMGDPGGANNEGFGTIIAPTFKDRIAVLVGPGRGMRVSYLSIQGPAGDFYTGYRAAQNSAGVGLGIAGGASRSLITCVEVMNFYTGIMTSANGNFNLTDANTFYKCLVINAYQSFFFAGIENFINTLYDCQAGGTIAVNNSLCTDTNVVGGNYSASDSRFTYLDMSGVGAITYDAGNDWYYIDVSSLTTTDRPTYDSLYNFSFGIFNAFVIQTAHFGAVPLKLVSKAIITTDGIFPALMTARFKFLETWEKATFSPASAILPASCDLQAEVQAATKIYCAEMVTTFLGGNTFIQGVHVENPDAVTCVIDGRVNFASGRPMSFCNSQLNWEPSISNFNTVNPRQFAGFVVQQAHPFIVVGQGPLYIHDISCQNSLALPYDWDASSFHSKLVIERAQLPPPNCRIGLATGIYGTADGNLHTNQPAAGGGEFDQCYTPAPQGGLTSDRFRGLGNFGPTQPYWGYRPAANTRPLIQPADVAVLQGTLPSIIPDCSYALMWGGLIYNVYKSFGAAKPFYGIVSDHNGWTYGQDITWASMAVTYKGRSNCVYMRTTSMKMMFPGLMIILSDGISDRQYSVVGIYDQLGYVTVLCAESENTTGGLQGDKLTVFTATTIKQQKFALRFVDVAASVNYQTPTTGFNIVLGNNDSDLLLQPAGTLATGTIQMCPAPYNTQRVSIRSSQVVTALTVSPNAGQSVAGAPTTLAVGVEKTAVYRAANTTWFFG